MLLTITTTQAPATDLGFLLAKHPERLQRFELSFGCAHVFYPEASAERCTAALLLEVDPVELARGRRDDAGAPLRPYVNDRPYVASSYLSVALAQVFGSALAGRSRDRPELAAQPLPLEARVAMLPCRGDAGVVRRLFEPLGYEVDLEHHALDGEDALGECRYVAVTLRGTVRLAELLSHLYVLIPALDADKHYFIGRDEVEKLVRHGEGWLAAHPERDAISLRYLARRRSLVRAALERLAELDETPLDDDRDDAAADAPTVDATRLDESAPQLGAPASEVAASGEGVPRLDETAPAVAAPDDAVPRRVRLHEQRLEHVAQLLAQDPATRSVLDLGCGEGRLLRLLLREPRFARIVGMDVAHRALEIAARKLRLERMAPERRARLELVHGSLLYRDRRLEGFDAAAVVEVIEHLDAPRLAAFERVLFGHARPRRVVLTTPNRDYNVLYESLPAGEVRHHDHRFEWSRAELEAWCERVGARFGYHVAQRFGIGESHPEHGCPTQGVELVRSETATAVQEAS